MEQINRLIRSLICLPILFYQHLIRPTLRPCCRYVPSCSVYACEAIHHFGPVKGGWVAVCRVFRCHPWSVGGYDPVLPNEEEKH